MSADATRPPRVATVVVIRSTVPRTSAVCIVAWAAMASCWPTGCSTVGSVGRGRLVPGRLRRRTARAPGRRRRTRRRPRRRWRSSRPAPPSPRRSPTTRRRRRRPPAQAVRPSIAATAPAVADPSSSRRGCGVCAPHGSATCRDRPRFPCFHGGHACLRARHPGRGRRRPEAADLPGGRRRPRHGRRGPGQRVVRRRRRRGRSRPSRCATAATTSATSRGSRAGSCSRAGRSRCAARPSRPSAGAATTASGSVAGPAGPAKVAAASRIWVEGRHDAELVEHVWGDDLRDAGIVVEPMHGIDDLVGAVGAFGPVAAAPPRHPRRPPRDRLEGVPAGGPGALRARAVTGHPFVDVWAGVRPQVLGLDAWPDVPRGVEWKDGHVPGPRRRPGPLLAAAAQPGALLRRPAPRARRRRRAAHRLRGRRSVGRPRAWRPEPTAPATSQIRAADRGGVSVRRMAQAVTRGPVTGTATAIQEAQAVPPRPVLDGRRQEVRDGHHGHHRHRVRRHPHDRQPEDVPRADRPQRRAGLRHRRLRRVPARAARAAAAAHVRPVDRCASCSSGRSSCTSTPPTR